MKPFNLEEAKAGKPVCTRDGRVVRILSYEVSNADYPIAALLTERDGKESVASFTVDGRFSKYSSVEQQRDLFMSSTTKTVWVNLYKGCTCVVTGQCATYPTEEEAKRTVIGCVHRDDYIGTFPITYEE